MAPKERGACCVCGAPAAHRCSRCQGVAYCSKACQGKDWPQHKVKCKDKGKAPELEKEVEKGSCVVCDAMTPHRCSNCRKVFYCRKSCQHKHWKAHKHDCHPFRMEESPELGRHYIAVRPLKAGEVILKEDPLVFGPLEKTNPVCLGCYAFVDGTYRCELCKWPMCGPECSQLPDHKPECGLLAPSAAAAAAAAATTTAASAATAAGTTANGGTAAAALPWTVVKEAYKTVIVLRAMALRNHASSLERLMKMQNHIEDRDKKKENIVLEKEIINQITNVLKVKFKPKNKTDTLHKFVKHILGAFHTNAFNVKVGKEELWGLYPRMAILEHSCSPNTRYKYNSSHQLTLKAAVDIAEGENLTNMYTNCLLGTVARRKHTLEEKFFMCRCKRCADPTEFGTNLSAIRCLKCEDGYLLPESPLDVDSKWLCGSCSSSVTSEEANKVTSEVEKEVDVGMASPNYNSLQKLIEDNAYKKVHYNHYLLLKPRHTILQLYHKSELGMKDWVLKKEKMCKDFLEICTTLDPGYARLAPYCGVVLYEYQSAVITRVQMISSQEYPDDAKISQGVDVTKALLQKCIDILHDEPSDQKEGKLRLLAERKLTEVCLLAPKDPTAAK